MAGFFEKAASRIDALRAQRTKCHSNFARLSQCARFALKRPLSARVEEVHEGGTTDEPRRAGDAALRRCARPDGWPRRSGGRLCPTTEAGIGRRPAVGGRGSPAAPATKPPVEKIRMPSVQRYGTQTFQRGNLIPLPVRVARRKRLIPI